MGNCMCTCLPKPQAQEEHHNEEMHTTATTTYPRNIQQRQEVVQTERKGAMEGEIGNYKEQLGGAGKGSDGGVVRVKLVLTKEELQWLMMQLKGDGEKRLENVLEEIERGRKRVVCDGRNGSGSGWKPSLDSIMETPESLEMDAVR
uniref:Uncharacterized protein n=1 Tax=Kalanchoe fedtschenkoi TaxID=63787 RepID=A0A7N0UL20_KALFE